jgi:inhibitor of KinA
LNNFQLTYKQFGERSILIEWPSKIDKKVLEDVLFFKEKLKNSSLKEIIYIKSAYSSLLVIYVYTINNIYDSFSTLKDIYSSNISIILKPQTLWKIPVCYDDIFGIDLDEISTKINLEKQDIIALHSRAIYTVFFIGFLPGFLYLGGLNKALNYPRKSTPRLSLEKGAVAIGGNQTGVYPNQSPGGWNVIGNSPISFFNSNKTIPCFVKPGDKIEFYPIDLKQHQDISTLVEAGVYQLESEVIRG